MGASSMCRVATRTYDAPPCGPSVRVVSQTKSRKKYPPEKTQLPPVFVVQAMLVPSSFGVAFAHNGTDGVPGHQHGVHAPAFAAVYGGYAITKKSGNMFRVGLFLDFIWLTTRTMHPRGAYVRRAKRPN